MIDSRWAAARQILAVRLDNLGDVLLMTPAIHAIRESLPEAELTLLTSPIGAQAGRLNPDLNDVIVYEAPWVDPWQQLPHDPLREQAMVATLAERQFDAVVIFTSFRQSSLPAAYLCYLAGVPLRLAASIDAPGSLLTTRHKHPEVTRHEVERGLELVAAVGMSTNDHGLVIEVPEADRQRVRQWVSSRDALADVAPSGATWGVAESRKLGPRCELDHRCAGSVASRPRPSTPLVVLHPGCSMPARTYPAEQFAEVAALLVERFGATVVVTGTESERQLVERVVAGVPFEAREHVVPLAGQLSFPVFCALIEAADLTVTNNTGPMHLSAAVGTPVVALFALTNPPHQWRPWQVPYRLLYHDVPCRICYSRVCSVGHECLRLVTPEMVVGAAAELMQTTDQTVEGATR